MKAIYLTRKDFKTPATAGTVNYKTMADLVARFGKHINRKAEVVWNDTGAHSKITHCFLGKDAMTEVVLVFEADLTSSGYTGEGVSNTPQGFADNGEVAIISSRTNAPIRHVHYMGKLVDRK